MRAEKSIRREKEGSKQAETSTSERPCLPGVMERSQEEGIFGHDKVSGPSSSAWRSHIPTTCGLHKEPLNF